MNEIKNTTAEHGKGIATTEPKPPAIAMGPRGVTLETLEDCFRFATAVVQSGLAPKGISTPQAVVVAIQMGAEVGLPPLASLQNIAVINGRPSIWGDAMLGVCRASGLFDESAFSETLETTSDGLAAVCTVRRLPDGNEIERRFTMKDAQAAGLSGKSGPWTQYPRRMLQLRARSWALRDGFADILRGMRAAEEERDCIVDVEVEPTKSLDELADKLEAPADPPFDPPNDGEIAANQSQLFREFAEEIAKADTPDRIVELSNGIDASIKAGTLAELDAVALQKEIDARLSK